MTMYLSGQTVKRAIFDMIVVSVGVIINLCLVWEMRVGLRYCFCQTGEAARNGLTRTVALDFARQGVAGARVPAQADRHANGARAHRGRLFNEKRWRGDSAGPCSAPIGDCWARSGMRSRRLFIARQLVRPT